MVAAITTGLKSFISALLQPEHNHNNERTHSLDNTIPQNTLQQEQAEEAMPPEGSQEPPGSDNAEGPREPVVHANGSFHMVTWRGAQHRAEILDRRKAATHGDDYEYYVHFSNYDRRLDQWVLGSAIEPEELEGAIPDTKPGKKEDAAADKAPMDVEAPPKPEGEDTVASRRPKRKAASMGQTDPTTAPSLHTDPHAHADDDTPDTPKIRNIDLVVFGRHLIKPWYYSPYPDTPPLPPPAATNVNLHHPPSNARTLFVCEYCLKYMRTGRMIAWHRSHCKRRKPPGRVLYAKGKLKIYEVDGKEDKLYCQNLSLLAKLFLDQKTVFYDIEPFLFYILTESSSPSASRSSADASEGDAVVGYFSKEKVSFDGYNLACILVLPPFQRRGFGRMLIEFSYELSKHQHRIGSPEKPLSDLGLVGYRSYWATVLVDLFRNNVGVSVSVRDVSVMTSICEEDVVDALGSMGLLRWFTDGGVCIPESAIKAYVHAHRLKANMRTLDPRCIDLTPA
ncbi:acyl-CoA N-acyltransferase [Fimicolochytrium jonesii]|uniref:acyl-CoA N-acyltransferase n=1 Tax=Fimicolochytrium jonesii TaxID=1396493 RepID=UPI0022FE35F0|nr:acyl-CoA N-acyltransferase [Fimicolochytrium jonesii]KAI8822428.1 acyl-CoA N-acyltransferase [Fimicolochytrium jonesii]